MYQKIPESQIKQIERLGSNLYSLIYSKDYQQKFFEKTNTGVYNPDFLDVNNETPLDSILVPLLRTIEQKTNKAEPLNSKVDLNKYDGKWYEILRLPNSFEKNSYDVTAEYTQKSGYIEVVNTSVRYDGSVNRVIGTAKSSNENNSRLDVTFFWPFIGGYNIIELGPEVNGQYSYSVVAGDDKTTLWVLSRDILMPHKTMRKIISNLADKGYDISSLILTAHR